MSVKSIFFADRPYNFSDFARRTTNEFGQYKLPLVFCPFFGVINIYKSTKKSLYLKRFSKNNINFAMNLFDENGKLNIAHFIFNGYY